MEVLEEALSIAAGIGVSKEWRPHHCVGHIGTYNRTSYTNEVLRKKCDQLLAMKYHGDIFRLLTETTMVELLSPFIDMVAGRQVKVSMGSVGHKFSDSPFAMLKRHCALTGRPVAFTPECLIGSSETRARRLRGEVNKLDRRLMRTSAGGFDASRFGLRAYNSKEKQITRELIVSDAFAFLGETPVKYLGLEDQHMESIRLVRNNLNFSPQQ